MDTSASSTSDLAALRGSLQGDVVLPGDPRYDVAKQLADVQFDAVRPRAIVFCETTPDVQAVIRFARDRGVPVAVRSGGHSTAGYSTTPGIILDVSRFNTVTAGSTTVKMGPGVQAVDAVNSLAPLGLATPNGFCPTVSAGGFYTGGGFGLLTRAAGMGSDRLVSAEVVLASGKVVRASEHQEPDLFWALRGGGGGNFGVITSYEIKPVRISRAVNFSLVWSWDSAADVVAGWQRWAPTVPDGLTSWMGIFLPDASPGQVAQVVVFGLWQGSVADLDPHLTRLKNAVPGPALAVAVDELAYQEAMMRWWFCGGLTVDQCHRSGFHGGVLPRTPNQTLRGRFFKDPLPRKGIDEYLAAFDADRRPGQSRTSLSAAFGGAVNRVRRTDTAFVHRTSAYHLDYTVAVTAPTPTDQDRAAARTWANNGFRTIDRYSLGESYQNYTDPQLGDFRRAYYAENYPRLLRVKQAYDPRNFFRFDQSVGRRPNSSSTELETAEDVQEFVGRGR